MEYYSESDEIHYCLECQSIAEELVPGYFKCTKCNFTWEVITEDKNECSKS